MTQPAHALRAALDARLQLLGTTLQPSTMWSYRQTVRLFLDYLQESFPELRQPSRSRPSSAH